MNAGYTEYKIVRNYVRQFDKAQFLRSLVALSARVSHSGPETWVNGYVPWEILLLARWIIADWEKIKGSKPVDIRVINGAINRIKVFVDRVDPLLTGNQRNGLMKFMRRMAFQQFWHQKTFGRYDIARAAQLLIRPKLSPAVEDAFFNHYGLDRQTTLTLLILSWSALNNPKFSNILRESFKEIEQGLPPGSVDSFFRAFSLQPSEFKFFDSTLRKSNYFIQSIEQSPLIFKPFLALDGRYYCWSIAMLRGSIEHGMYDLLKKIIPERFCEEFGNIFEGYLKQRLEFFHFKFQSEAELKKAGFPKQVDFLMRAGDDVVFIESKAIEASRHARTAGTDEILQNAYESDVVKGIAQAHECLIHMKSMGRIEEAYLIIVTYKELYLGNGEDAYEEFLKEGLNLKYGIENLAIPPSNIFFVPISAFDSLILAARGDSVFIRDLLKRFVNQKSEPGGRKFSFDQYLMDEKKELPDDPHLNAIFHQHFDELIARFTKGAVRSDQFSTKPQPCSS